MLDMECFSFLNRALEDEMAPIVIMATNRGTFFLACAGLGGVASKYLVFSYYFRLLMKNFVHSQSEYRISENSFIP